MKTLLTLVSASLLAITTTAQPVLTAATNSPMIGTLRTMNYGPYMAPGDAGAAQTWDLSALTTDSTSSSQIVAPANTPNGPQIPLSTVAEVNNAFTLYYNVDVNGIRFAGSDDGESLIVFSNMSTFLPFPCTFGTTWNSPQNGTYMYAGMQVVRTGTYTGEVDGYGSLITPNGTIDNVLRVHGNHTVQDVMGPMTIDFVDDSYFFYVPGEFHPIAEVIISTVDMGFGPMIKQYTRWRADIGTGVEQGVAGTASVHPNPASDDITVTLPSNFGAASSVTIVDMAGRTVMYELLRATSTPSFRIDVSSLFRGQYLLTVTSTDGQRSVMPLVVE